MFDGPGIVSSIRDSIIGYRYLHEINIVHGEITARNIFLSGPDKTGVTKVIIDSDLSSLRENYEEKDLSRDITGLTR
ncbi:Bgt-50562 [Blumeria graminis f. sp. tritici]|uniref:Bgt-50562 n=1 Tax=Blumeria graminis f. sp. tritici TaxID=62690 RepID=A0A9X9MKL4_BLUGR|nr:Bgt-50562 [Blumeria graminis f. sp. tritici]